MVSDISNPIKNNLTDCKDDFHALDMRRRSTAKSDSLRRRERIRKHDHARECEVAGISQKFTGGYNPRKNGITERANKAIPWMLKKRCGVHAEWEVIGPNVTSPNKATGGSLFFTLSVRSSLPFKNHLNK